MDLRAESETTRLERQAARQTIDSLSLSLEYERMRVYERPLTQRQLEDPERHVAEQEQLVYHAWKWLKRDPSRDVMVGNGRVSNTGLDDVVPPWRVKDCQCGRSQKMLVKPHRWPRRRSRSSRRRWRWMKGSLS